MRPDNARLKLESPYCRLIKRGDTFYVRFWENGAWKRVSTGTADRREAARYLAQLATGQGTPAPTGSYGVGDPLMDSLPTGGRSFAPMAASGRPTAGPPDQKARPEGHMVGPADNRHKKTTTDRTLIRELVTLRAAPQ